MRGVFVQPFSLMTYLIESGFNGTDDLVIWVTVHFDLILTVSQDKFADSPHQKDLKWEI
jgi:hypothetical protein